MLVQTARETSVRETVDERRLEGRVASVVGLQDAGQVVELVPSDPSMPEGGQASLPFPGVARGNEPPYVAAGGLGEPDDRAPDRGGVADGEGRREDPCDLGTPRVHGPGADLGDRVVRERPVEREPGVELLEVTGKLGGRSVGPHTAPDPSAAFTVRVAGGETALLTRGKG